MANENAADNPTPMLGARSTIAGTPTGRSLANINTNPVPDGTAVWVLATKQLFVLDRTSAAPPDGTTIIAPSAGPGRWILYPASSGAGALVFETAVLASASRLVDFDTTGLANGTQATVASFAASFVFDAASTDPANGVTIVAPLAGPGRWYRQVTANRRWTQQATWFLDPVGGDDENAGDTALVPLQTLAELTRRISGARIEQNTLITLAAGTYGELVLDLEVPEAITVTVQGAVQVDATGTFSAVTNSAPVVAPGASTRGDVTNTGGDPAFVNRTRLRLTNAPNAGAIAWVTNVIAADNANVNRWHVPAANGTPGAPVNAAIGNTYAVESFTSTLGRLDIQCQGVGGVAGLIVIRECIVPLAGAAMTHRFRQGRSLLAESVVLFSCVFTVGGFPTFKDGAANFAFCAIQSPLFLMQFSAVFGACVFGREGTATNLEVRQDATTRWFRSNCFDNGRVTYGVGGQAQYDGFTSDLEFVDLASGAAAPYTVVPGSYISLSGTHWGANNSFQRAFDIRSLGGLAANAVTVLNVPGASVADTRIGGTDTAYAALPFINVANGAAIVANV